jgi:hypothetical protein
MKSGHAPAPGLVCAAVLLIGFCYCLLYFDYFQTPSEDFIRNIRPVVAQYAEGDFPGKNFKLLPVYPVLLTLWSRVLSPEAPDPIYLSALVLNLLLYIPYMAVTFMIYRRLLGNAAACAALLFLSVNGYTVFAAVNADMEMTLSLLVVLAMHLSMTGSRFSYLVSFFAAATKWDSVFTVPAAMFGDFFYRGRRVLALVLGSLAASGVALWLLLSVLGSESSHPYVKEIARRGPNIYRYLVDCFLVTSGFVPWMAIHAWFSGNPLLRVPLFAGVIVFGAALPAAMVWGAVLLVRRRLREFAPVFVFFAGFLAIHMIYQNTKERYVLPVLWLLTLLAFYGLSEGLYPLASGIFDRLKAKFRAGVAAAALAVLTGAWLGALGMMLSRKAWAQCAYALAYIALLALILLLAELRRRKLFFASALLSGALVITLAVNYGIDTMDHYSLRRVEFKKAALWYRDNARPGDRMLVSEINVPRYYSGFGADAFFSSRRLRSGSYEELVEECKTAGITYVFVDDFYIRRLQYGDKTAAERKAGLFLEVLEKGQGSGFFEKAAVFETGAGIRSYIFRFRP